MTTSENAKNAMGGAPQINYDDFLSKAQQLAQDIQDLVSILGTKHELKVIEAGEKKLETHIEIILEPPHFKSDNEKIENAEDKEAREVYVKFEKVFKIFEEVQERIKLFLDLNGHEKDELEKSLNEIKSHINEIKGSGISVDSPNTQAEVLYVKNKIELLHKYLNNLDKEHANALRRFAWRTGAFVKLSEEADKELEILNNEENEIYSEEIERFKNCIEGIAKWETILYDEIKSASGEEHSLKEEIDLILPVLAKASKKDNSVFKQGTAGREALVRAIQMMDRLVFTESILFQLTDKIARQASQLMSFIKETEKSINSIMIDVKKEHPEAGDGVFKRFFRRFQNKN